MGGKGAGKGRASASRREAPAPVRKPLHILKSDRDRDSDRGRDGGFRGRDGGFRGRDSGRDSGRDFSRGHRDDRVADRDRRPARFDDHRDDRGRVGGKSSGKSSKGKGKGKDKFKSAAPRNSDFWVRKEEHENRDVQEGTFEGTIAQYSFKQGWGFILPTVMEELPDAIKTKLEEAKAEAVAKGKELKDDRLVYFRKPDVVEGYKPERDEAVTFRCYVDDKGAGACDVQGTWDEDEEAIVEDDA